MIEALLIVFVITTGILAAVRVWQVHRLGRELVKVRTRNLNTTIDRKGPNISTDR